MIHYVPDADCVRIINIFTISLGREVVAPEWTKVFYKGPFGLPFCLQFDDNLIMHA